MTDSIEWVALPEGARYISFGELPPGDYTFMVKTENAMAECGLQTMTVHVDSPWWYSLWLIVGVVILTACLIYIIYRLRNKRQVITDIAHKVEQLVNEPIDPQEEGLPLVLVADDNQDMLDFIKSELAGKYRVTGCSNGTDALDHILKDSPSVVISDVSMPKLDGFSLVKNIRQNINLNDVPIILISGSTMNEDYIKGLEVGADAYLTKPFDIRVLKQNISSLIKSRQTLKNIYSGNQAQEGKVDEPSTQTPDEILMDKVMRLINENISNTELSVEMIADEVGMSRVHLHRKLRQLTNQSPRDLIRNQRITQAAKLLKNKKRMPISEVAYAVGFSTPAHFATAFKAIYGMSPSQFVNTHH